MALWFLLALMTAAAVFAILWPLGRREQPAAAGSDLAVYRDQLAEITRDQAAGLIAEPEAQAARVEVSRRLLAAADADTTLEPAPGAARRRRLAALVALVLVPAFAVVVYAALGSPGIPDHPLSARTLPQQRSLAGLVAEVEAHLGRNPEDGRGWEVIAPVYFRLGRLDDAVKARRNALRLLGATAAREGDLGEALVAAANGVVTADAKAAFERARALDANDAKARFYLGVAAEQDGRQQEAADIWRDMLATAPADAPWIETVRAALARVDGTAPPPGPSADDVAAASQLSPDQRAEMVRGMVARLAERLQRETSDIEGWLRLVRAYVVLGDREKARAAADSARKALAGEQDKARRIDDLVKELGLEG